MSSIVLELQREAMEHSGSVLGLLRKTIVVSTKLAIEEVRKWAKSEIEGYQRKSDVPEYRRFTSQLKCQNPFHGWQPVMFEASCTSSLEWLKKLTDVRISSPIAEVEAWFGADSGFITIPLPPEIALKFGLDLPTARIVPISAISIIPDRIRAKSCQDLAWDPV